MSGLEWETMAARRRLRTHRIRRRWLRCRRRGSGRIFFRLALRRIVPLGFGIFVLQFLQFVERKAENAAVMNVEAVDGVEAFSLVGEGAEGAAPADIFVVGEVALFEIRRLRIHFHVEHGGLVARDAAEIPARLGHLGDEVHLGGADGLPFIQVRLQDLLKLRGVFVLQDESFGGDAVLERVVV